MEDIAPNLLKAIQTDFQTMFDKSKTILNLYAKVRDGTATYIEANNFAIETGDILANAFSRNLSSAVLPDGKMYYNIAQRIIEPMMKSNYDLVSDISTQVQNLLNQSSNIRIKAIKPELNVDKIEGIINKVSNAEHFDDVAWVLGEPIKTFSQSIVDDTVRENVEFHANSGMRPIIKRTITGNCCDWCRAMAGTYTYPDDVPKDVYRRHQNCRCQVLYDPKDGRKQVQNVYSKQWKIQRDDDKIEQRKTIGTSLHRHSATEMYLKTGSMSAKEYAEFKTELNDIKNRQQIILPKTEYAQVMSELNTHMTEEDRKHAIVTKAIGNYYYTIVNKGYDDYTIIAKKPIVSDVLNDF